MLFSVMAVYWVGWPLSADDSDVAEGTVFHLTFIQCASLSPNANWVTIDRLERTLTWQKLIVCKEIVAEAAR